MTLINQLNTLEFSGLIRLSNTQSEVEYIFRHALTHDAAYSSLVKTDRQQIHGLVGETLESLHPDQLAELAPRLGQHFEEAGDADRTLKYFTLAGDVAARIYANEEARQHYTRALKAAKRGGAATTAVRQLYTKCGRVLELSGRFNDALANYDEMESQAIAHGDQSMALASLVARGTLRCTPTPVADQFIGRALSEQALSLARELGDRQAEATILRNLMLLNNFAAHLNEAVEYGEQSLTIARELGLREQVAYTLNDLFRPYASIGQYEHAWAVVDEAREFWRETGNYPMLADNLSRSARILVALGEFDRAIVLSEQARQISHKIGNLWGQSFCRMFVSYVYLERGEMSTGIETMQECIQLGDESGFMMPQVATRADLGWIYGTLGAVAQGLELALVGRQRAEQRLPTFRTWALACLARLYVMSSQFAEAETMIQEGYATFTEDFAQHAPFEMALAEAELALAKQEGAHAIDVIDGLLVRLDKFKIHSFRSDAIYLKGKALIQLDRVAEARSVLQAARAEAESLGSRRMLWQILAALSEIETEHQHTAEAETLLEQAREIIAYIADHCPAELRSSFLNLPDVRALQTTAHDPA
jgi:tetratricopeptide (TPR) repeat protein